MWTSTTAFRQTKGYRNSIQKPYEDSKINIRSYFRLYNDFVWEKGQFQKKTRQRRLLFLMLPFIPGNGSLIESI